MIETRDIESEEILNSLADGVYVTDTERRIVFWSEAAERITGWKSSDVIGRACGDNLLCHVDKDDHALCGQEYCPLHRSIVTGQSSTVPVVVFATGEDGHRIPTQVSVAPLRDETGEIIGGIEAFRDLTGLMQDLNRAKQIQTQCLKQSFEKDEHVAFSTHYIPRDVVGGDFFAVEKDDSGYAFFLADVMGHGMAAALYTMQLRSLWEEHRDVLGDPLAFMRIVNERLRRLVGDEGSFAAGVFGTFDAATSLLRLVGAGNPAPIHLRDGAPVGTFNCSGVPLGLIGEPPYSIEEANLREGDRVFLFTDGATEVLDKSGKELGGDGLSAILEESGYAAGNATMTDVENRLLAYSNNIRLSDDLTVLELSFVRRAEAP